MLLHAQLYGDNKPTEKEEWLRVEISSVVEAIDRENKVLEVAGPKGHPLTIGAGEAKRFDEVKVGDRLAIEYWTFMRAEFREPTPQERAEPLVVVTDAALSPPEAAPGATVGAVVKAVVRVASIDRNSKQVVLQGPRGKYTMVQTHDDDLLDNLLVGERFVMMYAEAAALSLTPLNAPAE
ncbi:MAG: hypothetical protein DHS20C11_35260 [Lysobacteraceae bacterium]|nr:MAG: hypothetical protein DHS20C11_35260 [Xanthomonadaceae bacterium]